MVTAQRKRKTLSRPERRAQNRLGRATNGYNILANLNTGRSGGHIPNKPGKIHH